MKNKILSYIYEKAPMQQKKINKYLLEDDEMNADLSRFLDMYQLYMKGNGISPEELADSYLTMVNQMMQARIEFTRTGNYPVTKQDEALGSVYGNNKVMTQYMMGLALSQFLWKHHYRIFKFYREQLGVIKPEGKYLEVGSGHGLFTVELMAMNLHCDSFDIVDISQVSLDITKQILKAVSPQRLDCFRFISSDITLFNTSERYDFITMGEVLEHVDNPSGILRSLCKLLNPGGKIFITTCINSPAIDHVFHFKSVKEISDMLSDSGFAIIKEIVVPSEDKSPEIIERYKLDVLYAAILGKGEVTHEHSRKNTGSI